MKVFLKMMRRFFDNVSKNWGTYVVVAFLWLVSLAALSNCYQRQEDSKTKKLLEEVEYKDSLNNYNKVYYDAKLSDLKKENKELYDSLKDSKNVIDYLVQFKYQKGHSTGIVYINKRDTLYLSNTNEPRTFVYTSEPNDTFEYKLSINSEKEPNWYSLDTKFKEKFTIVNKEDDNGLNHITIGGEQHGDIADVTVFKKKEKNGIIKRLRIGPSITAGYDPFNKKLGMVVGVGVTYDLSK